MIPPMSPDHPAIRVSHLGKRYTIGGPQETNLLQK